MTLDRHFTLHSPPSGRFVGFVINFLRVPLLACSAVTVELSETILQNLGNKCKSLQRYPFQLSIITMVYNYYMTFNVEDKLGVLLGQPDEHADFGMLASAGGTVCICRP